MGGGSAGAVEALAEVLVHILLEDPERAAHAYGGKLAVVDQAVDGHLGHPHHRRDLGHRQETAAGHETEPVNIDLVPGATFTHPQVASVGMTEEQAKETGRQIKVGKFKLGGAGASVVYDDRAGLVKIVGDPEYGEILGAHIIGAHATELIHELAVARENEFTVEEVELAIHAHPTLSEAVAEAALDSLGKMINF